MHRVAVRVFVLFGVVASAIPAQVGETTEKAAEEAAEAKAPVPTRKTLAPAAAIARGCEILLALAEGKAGDEWPYEGVYRAREGNPRPVIPIGYRVGGTAIVCDALLTAKGYAEAPMRQEAVARGVGFILGACDDPHMQPSTKDAYDVRGWGHIYALHLFVKLAQRGLVPKAHAAGVEKRTAWLLAALHEQALPRVGGWNYASRRHAAPFMTGPALQVLFAAAAAGHAVRATVVDEALAALERARAQSGSVAYGVPAESRAEVPEDKLRFMDKLEGAMGRMLTTETTLDLAGRGDQKRLAAALDTFFSHWQELEKRRKQGGTHVQPFGVAPYYVFFAHTCAAQAIERLHDQRAREEAKAKLYALLAQIEEDDGGWNDRVFPRSRAFGTAMVVLALCAPHEPPLPGWPPPSNK
jgi:hypothetical protein